ncbi:MAG: serine--tRNA ligase [Marinilabiliales bacterium]|nr:MAG: serine--tRNA ligase [Marinilabiliales bacterium]
MLQIKYIRDNKQEVIDRLKIKNFDAAQLIEDLLNADEVRRTAQKQLDDTLAVSKQLSKEIGQFFKTGQKDKAEEARNKTTELKAQAKELEQQMSDAEKDVEKILLDIPNLPHPLVPKGNSDADNVVTYEEGSIPELNDGKLPHWELTDKYQIIDFDLGSKVSGAGFPFYRGKGARLQRALINFFLDEAIENGYLEYQPPLLVNEASGYGTGQLPDKEGQMYHATEDNLYLIPTAEVPITNIYRNTILKEVDFPIKNVAYSNCFRREAGSYGKDVRGLNRLHQFDKVEIVQIQSPEKSYDTLEEMKDHVANLLRKLELPFRILRLCGGDISFASALTFDFEVYSAAQERWLEVSSVSNFESFQANRMMLRYKDKDGKTQLAHTLNGSALALPRIVAALLENNQTAEGIKVPKALVPYTGFELIN